MATRERLHTQIADRPVTSFGGREERDLTGALRLLCPACGGPDIGLQVPLKPNQQMWTCNDCDWSAPRLVTHDPADQKAEVRELALVTQLAESPHSKREALRLEHLGTIVEVDHDGGISISVELLDAEEGTEFADVLEFRDAVLARLVARGWSEPEVRSYSLRWCHSDTKTPEVCFYLDPNDRSVTYDTADGKECGTISFDDEVFTPERVVEAIDRLRWVIDGEKDAPILAITRDVARGA